MPAQLDKTFLRAHPGKAVGRLLAWALLEGRPLTTRGRWINPVVFALYRLAGRVRFGVPVADPILIIGTGRSGTTFLGTVLGAHPQALFLNEPKAMWHHAHGGEDVIGSYTTAPARFRLDASDATPDIARSLGRIYAWALWVTRAQRIVDKYPELVFRMPFVRTLFPGARFVCIQRDGVDTVLSVTSWSRRKGMERGGHVEDWWGLDDRKWQLMVAELVAQDPDLAPLREMLAACHDHRDRAAVEWILATRAAALTAPDLLTIRYEDLCAAPQQVLGSIQHFAGLSPSDAPASYAVHVMEQAPPRGTLELMPELVDAFCATLDQAGYPESAERVRPRDDERRP
ncbi:MAG: sulfotransferase [Rhodobacteraceae bacterium]|nr:sulfotransferase [Paracoccaceae bacterium]